MAQGPGTKTLVQEDPGAGPKPKNSSEEPDANVEFSPRGVFSPLAPSKPGLGTVFDFQGMEGVAKRDDEPEPPPASDA